MNEPKKKKIKKKRLKRGRSKVTWRRGGAIVSVPIKVASFA